MATRRRPDVLDPPPDLPSTKTTTTTTTTSILPSSSPHPLLPTPLEATLLAMYPITLFLGSLTSTISPLVRASKATYSPAHQSYQPPHQAPSYFAQKRNVLNIYFVKIGWFWTTLALFAFVFTHSHFGAPLTLGGRRRLAAVFRWGAVSLVWFLTTQWCFGPALIDRSFVFSGGACRVLEEERAKEAFGQGDSLRRIVSHAQCKAVRGTWSGGIDISGHVFLLILGSAMLWLEVLPAVLKARGLREARRIVLSDGRVVSARKESQGVKLGGNEVEEEGEFTRFGVKIVLAVVGLSWWMLLMTAAFFHTWSEKLFGMIVAFAGLWFVYFLPRGVPKARAVFGIPGV